VRLEELRKFKKISISSSGFDRETFQLVAEHINHLRYGVSFVILLLYLFRPSEIYF
jgi:hypothetical protein